MPAYVIFYSTPIDQAKLAEYAQAALATLTAYGGTPVVLGPVVSLHNGTNLERGAIFSFVDRAAAEGWYESPDYSALSALRGEAMRASITIVG